MISYYYDLSEVYPREGLRVIAIKGFAGNKNITAASISFKIPFAIYILLSSKNRFIKSISYLILTAGIFAISLIEARAAILSTIIVFLLILVYFIYSIFKNKQNQNSLLKNALLFATPYLIAFSINMFATSFANDKYRKVTIADTLGKISFTEQSSNGRFNYWGDAWDYIKENPIFASGLGNWKIESIDKGKEHISGYTVPYHAHNDFIHVFAETGIIGGTCYLTLFLLIIYYVYKIIKHRYKEHKTVEIEYFMLILPLIVYGVDALLNFPVARPLMQSSLAIYLGLILSLYSKNCIDSKSLVSKFLGKGSLFIVLILLLPGLYIHILSFSSLDDWGRLLL